MRQALSTYLFVEQRLTVALLDRILKSGIQEIELFCARQHLDYRNLNQIEELKHWFDDSELRVHSIHSPMFSDDVWGRTGPNSILSITQISKAKRIAATDEIKRALEIADMIPFRYLIQHIGVAEEEFDPSKFDAAFNSLDELIVFGKQLGVEVLIENIPNELSTAERLNTLLQSTHLPLNFCFDIGHAHLGAGVEHEFAIMKERIRSTHVHDNDGKSDSHLFPLVSEGGTIDWKRAIELLRSCEEQTPLLLELSGAPEMARPLDQVTKSLDQLESL